MKEANFVNANIQISEVVKCFFFGMSFMIFPRFIIAFQYLWSSKYCSKMLVLTALKSEYDFESFQVDLLCIGAAISSILILPQEYAYPIANFIVTLSFFLRRKQNDPAIGLAWSFYFGYLKKVLPKFRGNVNRCKCKDDTLPKLLILVPADCKIHHSLEGVDSRLEFKENLEPHTDNVAGIQQRKYIHSSYKIEDPNFEIFNAALEYATPLNTLRDMCASKKANFSEAERDRQALLFYDTIKDIIENNSEQDDPKIKECVEFVFLPKNANIVDKIIETVKQM